MSRTPRICPDKLTRMLTLAGDTVGALRPDSATVLRRTLTSDTAGGYTEAWASVATGLSARVQAQGMQPWEKMDRVEGRIIATSVWRIALPAGTDVRPYDRVRVDSLSNTVYDVIASDGPSSFEVERTVQAVIVA